MASAMPAIPPARQGHQRLPRCARRTATAMPLKMASTTVRSRAIPIRQTATSMASAMPAMPVPTMPTLALPRRYTIKDLRTPVARSASRGTKVRIDDLVVLGLRAKSSFGFHGRDLNGSQDYAGVLVFIGGSARPRPRMARCCGSVTSSASPVATRYSASRDEIDQLAE